MKKLTIPMNKSALFPLRINPGLWNDGLYRDWPADTLQSMYLHENIETILGSCAGSGRKINFSDSVVGLGSQERNKVIKKTTGKRRAILLDIF